MRNCDTCVNFIKINFNDGRKGICDYTDWNIVGMKFKCPYYTPKRYNKGSRRRLLLNLKKERDMTTDYDEYFAMVKDRANKDFFYEEEELLANEDYFTNCMVNHESPYTALVMLAAYKYEQHLIRSERLQES